MADDDDAALELEALSSIYGDDARVDASRRRVEIDIPSSAAAVRVTLTAVLPPAYPAIAPPAFSVCGAHLDPADAAGVAAALASSVFTPGAVCVYEAVEALRARDELFAVAAAVDDEAEAANDEAASAGEPSPPPRSPSLPPAPPSASWDARCAELGIVSHAIVHNSCKFQAHTVEVRSVEEVARAVDLLLQNPRIARATHNIMAYRFTSETGALHEDADDDGEAAAGGRVLFMLRSARVDGAAVVVSRWFGGKKLGPARFGIINNVARAALVERGFIAEAGGKKK